MWDAQTAELMSAEHVNYVFSLGTTAQGCAHAEALTLAFGKFASQLVLKRLRIDTLYLSVANRCRTQSCMMSAVSQLQIARQEVYQASFTADAARTTGDRRGLTATLQCQQYAQRWTQNAEFSSLCARLGSEVTLVQSSTRETVFARQVSIFGCTCTRICTNKGYCIIQLVAYKLAVIRNGDSSVLFSSPVNCTTRYVTPTQAKITVPCYDTSFATGARFKLGHKGVNQYGFSVMLTPEDAILGPVHPAVDLRCAHIPDFHRQLQQSSSRHVLAYVYVLTKPNMCKRKLRPYYRSQVSV